MQKLERNTRGGRNVPAGLDGNNTPVANNTGSTVSHKITFTFTGTSNNIEGFECSLDNSAFSSCTSPKTYVGLSTGDHTFKVRTINSLGTKDLTPAIYKWKILTPVQSIQKLIDTVNNLDTF